MNGIESFFFTFILQQFSKDSGNQVEECKLKVNYVSPHQPPSPVREGSEEGSSPRASISDNVTVNTNDSSSVSFLIFNWFFVF